MVDDKENQKHILLPPLRLLPYGEFPLIIEPPFHDVVPQIVAAEVAGEYEEFSSKPVENQITPELIYKVKSLALTNEKVKLLLDGKRYIPIGVSMIDKRDEKITNFLFVFYNYSDNLVIEVLFDPQLKEILEVKEAHYQPAPVRKEIEEAVKLARIDKRIAEYITGDMEGNAILVGSIDPEDPYYNHRQFDVRFGFNDERLPHYVAIVDLSTETVLQAGPVCSKRSQQCGGGQ